MWMHHQLPLQAAGVESVHRAWNKINDEVRKLGTFIDNTIASPYPISPALSVTVSRCSVLENGACFTKPPLLVFLFIGGDLHK